MMGVLLFPKFFTCCEYQITSVILLLQSHDAYVTLVWQFECYLDSREFSIKEDVTTHTDPV